MTDKTLHPRLQRENQTVQVMIKLYCRSKHGSKTLCPECGELAAYAQTRLEKCPFQEGKTTCAKCSVHCYSPIMRIKIREVMRFSGPRMIYKHPLLAIMHLIDGRRNKPIQRPSEHLKTQK